MLGSGENGATILRVLRPPTEAALLARFGFDGGVDRIFGVEDGRRSGHAVARFHQTRIQTEGPFPALGTGRLYDAVFNPFVFHGATPPESANRRGAPVFLRQRQYAARQIYGAVGIQNRPLRNST